jgi:hypothetical protein
VSEGHPLLDTRKNLDLSATDETPVSFVSPKQTDWPEAVCFAYEILYLRSRVEGRVDQGEIHIHLEAPAGQPA